MELDADMDSSIGPDDGYDYGCGHEYEFGDGSGSSATVVKRAVSEDYDRCATDSGDESYYRRDNEIGSDESSDSSSDSDEHDTSDDEDVIEDVGPAEFDSDDVFDVAADHCPIPVAPAEAGVPEFKADANEPEQVTLQHIFRMSPARHCFQFRVLLL